MNSIRFWLAIFTLLGFAVLAPAWMYFAHNAVTMPPVTEWLLALVLPVAALLTVASWLQPGGA
jgi:hypothetical protein